MFEIVFVRHGETEWNRGRRIMGAKPIPLNKNGQRQLQELKAYFKDVEFDAIYTSPIVRAAESAAILAQDRQIQPIEDEALAEINYGPWVGMTFDEVREQPEFADYHLRPSQAKVPGGEDMDEVFQRIGGFVERLRQECQGQRVLAVSHADVIKLAIVKYLAMPLDDMHRMRIDNGSHSHLWFSGPIERVLIVNGLPRVDGFFEKTSLFAREYPFKDQK